MGPEHLGIGDRKFLINRLIQQAPINTLVREFFKNADENAALAPIGRRIVEIQPTMIDGVRKLTFFNTGVGMSASELKTATDLSSSVNKMMSLDGNFGIGAKGLVSPRLLTASAIDPARAARSTRLRSASTLRRIRMFASPR